VTLQQSLKRATADYELLNSPVGTVVSIHGVDTIQDGGPYAALKMKTDVYHAAVSALEIEIAQEQAKQEQGQ
jgi:hypothetical protein